MKQTPTQRHFKAEMARAKKKYQTDQLNPYEQNLYRIKTPKKKTQGWLSTVLIVFIVMLFMATWNIWRASQHPEDEKIVPLPIATISNPGEKLMSHADALFFKSLQIQQEQIDTSMETINAFHQMPWEERNKQQYQQALMHGIAICQQSKLEISNINSPDQFETFTSLTLEYIEATNKALAYYLQSSSTRNPSMVEQGNAFMEIATEKRAIYMQTLESYLKTNGYKYQQTVNGLKYWYRE